jgi:hypothetical protein
MLAKCMTSLRKTFSFHDLMRKNVLVSEKPSHFMTSGVEGDREVMRSVTSVTRERCRNRPQRCST